jgi:capsular exopolysaccharide synthesis family protein
MPSPVFFDETMPSLELRNASMQYGNEFAMRDYLDRLTRHKKLILLCTGGLMLLALLVSLMMTPVYEAKGTVELNIVAPKVTKFEDFQADPYKLEEFIQTQVELFKSTSLADRVIGNLKLASNPAFSPFADGPEEQIGVMTRLRAWLRALTAPLKNWLSPKADSSADFDLARLEQEKVLQAVFTENLSVTPKPGTKIISVAFSSSDPVLARNITNELITEFIKWEIDRKVESNKAAKNQLERQIRNVNDQLSTAEAAFSQFAQEAGIVSFDSKTNIVFQELEQVNQALAAIETERIKKKEIYEEARKSDVRSLPAVLQNALIQNLKNQYIDIMSEYEKLRVVYKDDYPEVKRIRAKMEDINRRLRDEQDRILKSLLAEYQAADKVARALAEKAHEKKDLALKLNTLAGKYKILGNKVDMNQQIYLSLLERSKEIDANVGTDLGKIQLVDLAAVPLYPYKPNKVLYILVAALLGIMGGSGLAFLREYLDSTVKRVEEISDQYRIPMLAVLPATSQRHLICPDESEAPEEPSAFAEGIRFARVSITHSSTADGPAKSLLFTSTIPNEGKSTISVHLANSFAGAGETVLLIDADLRKPSQNGGSAGSAGFEYGLTHYLNGIAGLDEIIQKTKVPNLYFVHSGHLTPPNPNELLNSNPMRALIQDLTSRFDRIILDGPPFGADAMVLGNLVDGVILITTLGQTQRAAIQIARKSLLKTNSRLIGSIVNNVDFKQYPETRHYQNWYSYCGLKAANYLSYPAPAEKGPVNQHDVKKIILGYYSRATKTK